MVARLQDKVAVITGATSGIGEETARRFVAEGANAGGPDRGTLTTVTEVS